MARSWPSPAAAAGGRVVPGTPLDAGLSRRPSPERRVRGGQPVSYRRSRGVVAGRSDRSASRPPARHDGRAGDCAPRGPFSDGRRRAWASCSPAWRRAPRGRRCVCATVAHRGVGSLWWGELERVGSGGCSSDTRISVPRSCIRAGSMRAGFVVAVSTCSSCPLGEPMPQHSTPGRRSVHSCRCARGAPSARRGHFIGPHLSPVEAVRPGGRHADSDWRLREHCQRRLGDGVSNALVETQPNGTRKALSRDKTLRSRIGDFARDNTTPLGYGFEREVDVFFDGSVFKLDASSTAARRVAW